MEDTGVSPVRCESKIKAAMIWYSLSTERKGNAPNTLSALCSVFATSLDFY